MSRSVHIAAAAIAVCLLSASGASALPAGGTVLLAFGATYTGPDGRASVHRGVDVACEPGDAVLAPAGGRVAFVGRVPDASGSTMLAVTLSTAEGSLTLMPLQSAGVAKGDTVERGASVGVAAGFGDRSGDQPHVHVGLRRGDVYVDPSALVVAPVASGTDMQGAAVSAADGAGSAVPAPPPVTEPVVVAGPVVTPSCAPAGAPLSGTVFGSGSTPSPDTGGVSPPAEGRGFVATAGDVQPSPADGAPVTPSAGLEGVGLPASHVVPASPLETMASALVRGTRSLSAAGVVAVLASVLASCALLTRRTLSRRVVSPATSDRLGYLLQHLKAGDTLRGLTSCSGPLPSQSRGRIAQGR